MGEFNIFDSRKEITAKAPNTMNIVLAVIVVISALISLGEFSLTLTGAINVSLIVIILYIVSSIMYKNAYAGAIEKGKQTEQYLEAKRMHDEVVKDIYDKGLVTKLPEMCIEYCREDLKNCRAQVLLDACIPYDVYEAEYLGRSEEELRALDLPQDAVKCILAANKIRGLHLTAGALLSDGEGTTLIERAMRRFGFRRGIGIESRTRQQIDFTTNSVSRAITTCLAGAVTISIVLDDFSVETLALWAMKMLPVAIAVLGGNNGGTRNVTDTLIPQLEKKTKILKTIMASVETSEMLKNVDTKKQI